MLLDLEGLGDRQRKDKTAETQMLVYALLLSKVFIYNVKGNLDSDILENLQYPLLKLHVTNSIVIRYLSTLLISKSLI